MNVKQELVLGRMPKGITSSFVNNVAKNPSIIVICAFTQEDDSYFRVYQPALETVGKALRLEQDLQTASDVAIMQLSSNRPFYETLGVTINTLTDPADRRQELTTIITEAAKHPTRRIQTGWKLERGMYMNFPHSPYRVAQKAGEEGLKMLVEEAMEADSITVFVQARKK